jgi:hypothetical protein
VLLPALAEEAVVRSNALAELAERELVADSALESGRGRVPELMAGPLQTAKANRAVHRDLTLAHVLIEMPMIRDAGLLSSELVVRTGLRSRALTLALGGRNSAWVNTPKLAQVNVTTVVSAESDPRRRIYGSRQKTGL